jgi:hypothetical protein
MSPAISTCNSVAIVAAAPPSSRFLLYLLQSSCVKSYVRPAVIGADGLEFTQVHTVQRLYSRLAEQ